MLIPRDVDEVFREIREEVIWVHARWIIYRQLFRGSDKRIDLLNETAPVFFYVIQNLLTDEALITLSKLTDPARTGKFENLSLEQLQERVEREGNGELSGQLRGILDELKAACDVIRRWRHKQLAHLDLETALREGSAAIPDVEIEQIEHALHLVREYMNRLEQFYTENETGYEHFMMTSSDGEALVAMLKLGLRYEELRNVGSVPWEDASNSTWVDA